VTAGAGSTAEEAAGNAADAGSATGDDVDVAGDSRLQPTASNEADNQLSTEILSAHDFGLNTRPN